MIKKRFFKTKDQVEITFQLKFDDKVEGVSMVCDAHDWHPMPMRHKGKGTWQLRTRFPVDRVVQFRYLASGGRWLNDDDADGYVPNGMGGDNSIVVTTVDTQQT